jgi:hypothetical protein
MLAARHTIPLHVYQQRAVIMFVKAPRHVTELILRASLVSYRDILVVRLAVMLPVMAMSQPLVQIVAMALSKQAKRVMARI